MPPIREKDPRGICKVRRDALLSLLCVGNENSLVLKDKLHDHPLLGLVVGLQAPSIEETAEHAVPFIHPIFIDHIICYLLEYHADEDAEGSRCQDSTFPHAVYDGNVLDRSSLSLICPRWFSCNCITIGGKIG